MEFTGPNKKEEGEFISICSMKTPPMHVEVRDANDSLVETYDVASGFQLESYLRKLYPDALIRIYFPLGNFVAEVYDNQNQFIIQHTGKYLPESDEQSKNKILNPLNPNLLC